jgi:arabinofuranosyltransferase
VLGVGLVHALCFWTYVSDDAFISFRYAQRLLDGAGLTWTSGAPVEGYSDLLWVLFAAAGLAVGLDPVAVVRVLGLLGASAAIVAVSVDDRGVPDLGRTLSGGLLLAVSGGLAVWAVGGLEHSFLAGVVAWALVAIRRERWGWAAALLTVAVLTRADGAVLWVGALLGVGLARGTIPGAMLVPGLAVAGQEVFRLGFYGDWLPNSARVKVAPTALRAWRGIGWTARALVANGVLVAAAVVAVGRARADASQRSRAVMPAAVAVVWCTYVALVGGDIFAGWRQLVPVFPAFALLAADLAPALPRRVWVGAAAVSLCVQVLDGSAIRAFSRDFVQDTPPFAEAMRVVWGAYDPLLAVDAAGALPYYTGFRALDMLGLNDPWLVHNPPEGFGGRAIGHDLGDADYVWSRAPDILVFRGPFGSHHPPFASGQALLARPDFSVRYSPVDFGVMIDGAPMIAELQVRRDGPLGLITSMDAVEVPPWFFATHGAIAAVGPQGVLGVGLTGDKPAVFERLSLPPGTWSLETRPADVRLDVLVDGRSVDRRAPGALVLELERAATIDVLAWAPTAEVVRFRSVVARRVAGATPTHAVPRWRAPARMRLAHLGQFADRRDGPLVARVDARGLELAFRARPGDGIELAATGQATLKVEWLRGHDSGPGAPIPATGLPSAGPVRLVVPRGGADGVRLTPMGGGAVRIGRR